jgi:glyoxylase-like metal-dependent hydrolase (beta-lactamase superfamily II)
LIKLAAVLLTVLSLSAAHAQLPDPNGGPIERGTLPDHWSTGGPKCMEMPEWQVHEYNPNLYLMRQSGCTDYEKPFVFLLFGKDKAMLLDTGSRNGDIGPTLQRVVHRWLQRNSRTSIPLIVAHTHEHEDHVWGDPGILALNDPAMPVTLVKATVADNQAFFHITHWPDDLGSVDLGGRMVDVIAIPGHSDASVAFYDRNTAILFSGDTVYPGRLYVHNFPDFVASIDRLVRFTDGKLVAQVIGNHIEETSTPYLDYPTGTMYQPNEHILQLSRGTILELQAALATMHGTPQRLALRDVTIWPSKMTPAQRDVAKKSYEETQKYQHAHMWDQTQP